MFFSHHCNQPEGTGSRFVITLLSQSLPPPRRWRCGGSSSGPLLDVTNPTVSIFWGITVSVSETSSLLPSAKCTKKIYANHPSGAKWAAVANYIDAHQALHHTQGTPGVTKSCLRANVNGFAWIRNRPLHAALTYVHVTVDCWNGGGRPRSLSAALSACMVHASTKVCCA